MATPNRNFPGNTLMDNLTVTQAVMSNATLPYSLGVEKLSNGTFTGSAASWTLGTGWEYVSNLVRKDADGTGTLSQTSAAMQTPLVVGEYYILTYTISSWTVGSVTPSIAGVTLPTVTYSGTYSETFQALSTADLVFTPTSTSRFYIDTISLKKSEGNLFAGGSIKGSGMTFPYSTLNINYGDHTYSNSLNFIADATSISVVNFKNKNSAVTLALTQTSSSSVFAATGGLYFSANGALMNFAVTGGNFPITFTAPWIGVGSNVTADMLGVALGYNAVDLLVTNTGIQNRRDTYIGDTSSLGTEKIYLGNFTGGIDARWTYDDADWSYGTNNVVKDADGTGTFGQTSANMVTPIVPGEMYYLSYNVSNLVAGGTLTPSCGGVTLDGITANGTYLRMFQAITNDGILFTPSNTSRFTLDTISLKKITSGNLYYAGKMSRGVQTTTLGVAATTLAIINDVVVLTGDAGGNTLATITGGVIGQRLTIIFTDANVTITDDGTSATNTVNLSAAFTSTANDTLTLIYDGTSWRETARSVN